MSDVPRPLRSFLGVLATGTVTTTVLSLVFGPPYAPAVAWWVLSFTVGVPLVLVARSDRGTRYAAAHRCRIAAGVCAGAATLFGAGALLRGTPAMAVAAVPPVVTAVVLLIAGRGASGS